MTRSCGCLRAEVTAQRSTTHGHKRGRKSTREIKSWEHAKQRCFNPANRKFPAYGGRGITMCGAWRSDFSAFFQDLGPCPAGKTLGRVDVDGHYEPSNCRWETPAQQARERTDNVWVEHNGERMILKDYAAMRGVPYRRLWLRMKVHGESAPTSAEKLLA